MFEIELAATIAKVTVTAKDEDGIIIRTVRLALDRELDMAVAKSIGKDALASIDSLKSGAMEKAVFGIGLIKARGKLVAAGTGAHKRDTVEIAVMLGRKATCTAPTEDDEPPRIRLEFEMAYDDKVWMFLGRNCLASAMVTLTKLQLEFPEAA